MDIRDRIKGYQEKLRGLKSSYDTKKGKRDAIAEDMKKKHSVSSLSESDEKIRKLRRKRIEIGDELKERLNKLEKEYGHLFD